MISPLRQSMARGCKAGGAFDVGQKQMSDMGVNFLREHAFLLCVTGTNLPKWSGGCLPTGHLTIGVSVSRPQHKGQATRCQNGKQTMTRGNLCMAGAAAAHRADLTRSLNKLRKYMASGLSDPLKSRLYVGVRANPDDVIQSLIGKTYLDVGLIEVTMPFSAPCCLTNYCRQCRRSSTCI